MGRNADPGRRDGLLPALALGYLVTPLQGFQNEAAASLPLHCLKNVQTPDARFRGHDTCRGIPSFPRRQESSRCLGRRRFLDSNLTSWYPPGTESGPPNACEVFSERQQDWIRASTRFAAHSDFCPS